MLVNVTGAVALPDGSYLTSAHIVFRRIGPTVAYDGYTLLPDEFTTLTDGSGWADFDCYPGVYDATASAARGNIRWRFNVPEDLGPSVAFEDCIDIATPVLTPSQVAEAVAAKDAAEAAAAVLNQTSVADSTALAALSTLQYSAALMRDAAYIPWVWDASNLSAKVSANDPRYIAPASAPTGASGAWKRAGSEVTTWAPTQWSGITGSLYNGAFAYDWTRTGGYGTYGLGLIQLQVTAATPNGEFDTGLTSWVTHRNLTGGSAFGGWGGANSPSLALGDTYSSGHTIGYEINVGNRWGSNGLKAGMGGTRDFVGLKLVPDVVPTRGTPAYEAISAITIATPGVLTRAGHGYYNGMAMRIYTGTGTLPGGFTSGNTYYVVNAATDTFQLSATFGGTGIATTGSFAAGVVVLPSYPADFLLACGQSVWKHQSWTGLLVDADAIVAGGNVARLRGGSVLARAPASLLYADGYFVTGLNLSAGVYTNNNAVYLGAGHKVAWSGAYMSSDGNTIGLTTGDASSDGILGSVNFGQVAFRWDGQGSVPRLAFYNATPIPKQTGVAVDAASIHAALVALNLIGA